MLGSFFVWVMNPLEKDKRTLGVDFLMHSPLNVLLIDKVIKRACPPNRELFCLDKQYGMNYHVKK